MTATRSWLHHSDVEIRRRIRIANVDSTPSLVNERVPDATELREMFNRTSLRTGAIMALMAKAGLRPEVLGNHNAAEGLVVRDLPELDIVLGIARFTVKPVRIVVRRTLSKAGHAYFTFVTELGAEKIPAQLYVTQASAEHFILESPVIE